MREEGEERTYSSLDEDRGLRLDQFLSLRNKDLSRSFLKKLIKEGRVFIGGNRVTEPHFPIRGGEEVSLLIPAPSELAVKPENIPLSILYEDEDLIIVNKPKGMVVHPAPGHPDHTLVNALLYHCGDSLSGINGVLRPGIVHRIDQDTTGSLIVCKNDTAHRIIADQIARHTVKRVYYGICEGNFKEEEGTVKTLIGRSPKDRKKMAVVNRNGKEAITHYKVLKSFKGYTYLSFRLETGRTHQIRVHMAYLGHPLLGDRVYGRPAKAFPHLEGQTLHAAIIGFIHPTRGEYMEFEAPLPPYFVHLLKVLEGKR